MSDIGDSSMPEKKRTPIKIPQAGVAITEGTIIEWLAAEGDQVASGQPYPVGEDIGFIHPGEAIGTVPCWLAVKVAAENGANPSCVLSRGVAWRARNSKRSSTRRTARSLASC